MKAIAIVPGIAGARIVERPEPSITAPDDVKLRVIRVETCGTDRKKYPEAVRKLLMVPGNSSLGTRNVRPSGEYRRLRHQGMSRRLCCVHRKAWMRPCLSCLIGRSDMCQTGKYRGRGIRGLDGYQTEFVVDKEQHTVRVPELEAVGVLMEPLSIVEKAIDEALHV